MNSHLAETDRIGNDNYDADLLTVKPAVRRWLPNILGLLVVIGAGLAVLVPALVHGGHLGPFDLLSRLGLTQKNGVIVHNTSTSDQVDAIMPWTNLAWTQVHNGQLPLWNPYGGLGTPLAFNWQSAPFGLPALIGYLVPVGYASTIGIFVTIIVAGTGTYFLGRVLGLGIMGSIMMGTVFELSGPFVGWLGWPHSSVMSWAGWLFAASLLIFRQNRRALSIAFFSVILALAFYAGQPEILILLLVGLGIFLTSLLIQLGRLRGFHSLRTPIVDFILATIAGAALAAPLILPGLQVIQHSVRNSLSEGQTLPISGLFTILAQGFNGLPISGTHMLTFTYYQESVAYLGVIAVVLTGVAIVLRGRRPIVLAFGVLMAVSLAIIFVPLVVQVLTHIPVIGSVAWHRDLLVLSFAVAVLAGIGLDALIQAKSESVWRWTCISFAGFGLIVLAEYLGSSGGLSSAGWNIRERSFLWPVFCVVAATISVGAVALILRRQRSSDASTIRDHKSIDENRFQVWVGGFLIAVEVIFLVTAGAQIWSSSTQYFAPTPAVSKLQHVVGSSTVGVAKGTCYDLGIDPNVNDVFKVHELNVYDPATPSSLYLVWSKSTGESPGLRDFYIFCPLVDSATLAREYGVQYLLTPHGLAGPKGTVLVGRAGNEDIYRVPDAGAATVASDQQSGVSSAEAAGKPIKVLHPTASSWKMSVKSDSEQELRLHLANVPGWHASIDGKPLTLEPYMGVMLQAKIPAGSHVIQLHYWPDRFTEGIVLATISALTLTTAVCIAEIRRRRRPVSK